MFPAVQLQRTARHPLPPPRSRILPRLMLKAQRSSPPSPSPSALVRLHRRPPRRHFQALRVTPHVVRFIPSQKQCHNHLLTFLLLLLFCSFPHPHVSNYVVTNCLTDAVAQVNCSSITAVACYCTNQYVNRHLLSLLLRVISPYPLPPPPKQDISSHPLRMCRIQLRRERALSGKPCPAILWDR
jgi:hypothetical protein